jgi:hypothetical protein
MKRFYQNITKLVKQARGVESRAFNKVNKSNESNSFYWQIFGENFEQTGE